MQRKGLAIRAVKVPIYFGQGFRLTVAEGPQQFFGLGSKLFEIGILGEPASGNPVSVKMS
jgi:hypothetical protein